MDRVITADDYGICLFSLDILQDFLKREKIKSKKLLEFFQKNPEKYLTALEEGAWIPFVQINAVEYLVRLDGYEPPFGNEWDLKFEYDGFNIETKDSLWISAVSSFYSFDKNQYQGRDIVSYQTVAGALSTPVTINTDFMYTVPSSKYLLSIKGYARKIKLDYPTPNCGFLFSLSKVSEFNSFKNPREEIYNFNVADM